MSETPASSYAPLEWNISERICLSNQFRVRNLIEAHLVPKRLLQPQGVCEDAKKVIRTYIQKSEIKFL